MTRRRDIRTARRAKRDFAQLPAWLELPADAANDDVPAGDEYQRDVLAEHRGMRDPDEDALAVDLG